MSVQDEVRALGRLPELNVPETFITRHPFPGDMPYIAYPPAIIGSVKAVCSLQACTDPLEVQQMLC